MAISDNPESAGAQISRRKEKKKGSPTTIIFSNQINLQISIHTSEIPLGKIEW